MKKLLSAFAVGSLCAMPMMGETYHTKGYGVMQTEDIYTVTVGPGTVETKTVVKFSTNASDNIEDINAQTTANILKVDLTNEYVTPKVAFADEHKIQDVKLTIPKMMNKHTSYANHYFAGVNGDFFGYITCGVTIADGTYVYAGNFLGESDPFEGNHFIIDKDGLPYIADHIELGGGLGIRNGYSGDATMLGNVTFPDNTKYDELRSNSSGRWDNYLVLYSPYHKYTKDGTTYYGSTGTNMWGTEAELFKGDDNRTIFGAEGEFTVGNVTKSGSGGNMTVPLDGYVLSGVGIRNFNDKVSTGDKVKVSLPFKADGVDNTCRETVGGWPRLVTDGKPLSAVPAGTPGDLGGSSRRARTAVGFSQDRKTLYIIVLDEGTTRNQGMTFKALGSFMEAIGCYNAMNLDGGGSSVLHVENLGQRSAVQGVMNGYNRPVMNGLFLVTNAPEDREITSIEIVDKSLNIKPGKGYVPTIYGYNKYGVLVCTNVTEFTLSAPAGTATFNSGDRKMIAPQSGEFTLTAKYKDATFEIPVKVSADGIDGVDPDTEATFDAQETTPVPENPNAQEEPETKSIYIAGSFNGWNPAEPIIVTESTDKPGVYEFDAESANILQFKFTTLDPRKNGGWAAFTAGDNGVGVTWHTDGFLVPGKKLELVPGNAGNLETPWAGKYHFVIDLENVNITATTETPRPAIDAPEHLYVIGTIQDHSWDTAYEGAELTGSDGVFTIENVTLAGDEAAYFAFTTKAAATWDDVNTSPRYGAWKGDAEFDGTTEYFFECWNSWKVKPAVYNITADFNTGEVTIKEVIEPIYAELQDVTPVGLNFDNFEVGQSLVSSPLPESTTSGTWTAPSAGIYSQDVMDAQGYQFLVHYPGMALPESDTDATDLADVMKGITIQDLGGEIGKCLVYNMNFGPGANVKGWPFMVGYRPTQLTFYADGSKLKAGTPVRVRLVMQLLHRGRHNQSETLVNNIYSSAFNAGSAWAINSDNVVGAKYPLSGKDFYRWKDEGTTIAEIPETIELAAGEGIPDPWDQDNTTNPYLMNGERFLVYEYDIMPSGNSVAIHINLSNSRYNTYIFKEVKFFNILNADEVAKQPHSSAPHKVQSTEPFTTNTAWGSLIGARNISYRYYTPEGVKEFDQPDDAAGVDDIVTDGITAPAEYYNLQGIRVENPANGVYIMKQGSKVTKVLVK